MPDHRQRPDRARRRDQPDTAAQEGCGPCRSPGRTACRSINLVESGGADLPTQSEIFIPGGAELPRPHPACPPPAIPTIALVFGNSTAGGAYVPGMSDYVVMVEGARQGVPRRSAAGEDGDRRGDRRRVARRRRDARPHVSGLADYFAVDELDAIRLGRQIVRRLNRRKRGPGAGGAGRANRVYDPEELLGIASADLERAVRPARRARARRSTAASSTSSSRSTARRWSPAAAELHGYPDRRPRQPARRAVQRGGAEGRAVHPAGQPDRHPAGVPAEHDRLHGRQGLRAARHHQGTARR